MSSEVHFAGDAGRVTVSMIGTESKLLHSLKMSMKDFVPGKDAFKNGQSSVYDLQLLPIKSPEMPLPYMVFLTFVGLLHFDYFGRTEKIAWSIPLVYQGTAFMMSHQKFGLQIAALTDDKVTTDKALKAVRQLSRGIRIADRLLTPLVASLVKSGDVTVPNKNYLMYDAYKHFREMARNAFEQSEGKNAESKSMHEVVERMNERIEWERKGFYYTRAMLDAFYSWLEHILVLLLPFCEFDKSVDSLEEFIRSDWTAKYNRVLKPDNDAGAKRLYGRLHEIKEKYRNTLAHGAFDKSGASLHAHMPVVGAIPVSLSEYRNSIHYSFFFPITRAVYSDICAAFDNVEHLLRERRFERPLRIIGAGLDIRFDDEGLTEYKHAVASDENTEKFVEATSYAADMYANMDW